MSSSQRFSSQNNHTVVLKSRSIELSQSSKIDLKQGDSNKTNLSPSIQLSGDVTFGAIRPPNLKNKKLNDKHCSAFKSNSLLVRFGIDSIKGRVITRILVFLILFQPVYIAFGMEIENVDDGADMQVEQSQNLEENSQDEIENISKNEDVQDEQVQNSEEISQGEVVDEPENILGNSSDVTEEDNDIVENNLNTDIENQNDGSEGELIIDDNNNQNNNADADNSSNNVNENFDEDEITTFSTTTATSTDDINDQGEDENSNDDTGYVSDENSASSTASSTDQSKDDDDTGGGSSGSSGSSSSDTTDDDAENATTTDNVSDGTATTTDTNLDSEAKDDNASSTSVVDEDIVATSTNDVATTSATSTEASDFEIEENVTVAKNAENKYTFAEGDCTLVSEGEFYCIKNNVEKITSGDPSVYAEKDREGDSEIFYFDGVEISRITNNSYDDLAPVFDENTKTIVWQAMINDRLQIMMHEIPTNTTRQITITRQNSSNPDIDGDTVVWQEWVETNWEIMMTNVRNNGQEFEIKQLTDNAVHDMFPQVYNDLITWQREKGSTWEIIVHNVRTGEEHSLEKNEDTKYENPRFVLLFDSKHDNGDIETIGYDLNTGEMMELGTKSKPIPDEPLTPKDKSSDAIPREAASSTQIIKVAREGGDGA